MAPRVDGGGSMPVLLTRDEALSERLRSARASTEYISRHWADLQERYAGQFVAVDNGQLLGVGLTGEEAFSQARSRGGSKDTTQIAFVPPAGTSCFY
jgi:hypothetical protein